MIHLNEFYQWKHQIILINYLEEREEVFSLKSRIFRIMKGHDKFSYFETQNDNNDN